MSSCTGIILCTQWATPLHGASLSPTDRLSNFSLALQYLSRLCTCTSHRAAQVSMPGCTMPHLTSLCCYCSSISTENSTVVRHKEALIGRQNRSGYLSVLRLILTAVSQRQLGRLIAVHRAATAQLCEQLQGAGVCLRMMLIIYLTYSLSVNLDFRS
jgi:hypothetical protein